jgi:hypothetical protein
LLRSSAAGVSKDLRMRQQPCPEILLSFDEAGGGSSAFLGVNDRAVKREVHTQRHPERAGGWA